MFDVLLTDDFLRVFLFSSISASLVGLVGILPVFIFNYKRSEKKFFNLELFLSISVGSQLADVFLNLFPRSSRLTKKWSIEQGSMTIVGLIFFFLVEKLFPDSMINDNEHQRTHRSKAFLNLLANFIDNFNHGLAIGGSFSLSSSLGLTTLFSILVHEIPHEIGDFAVLLQSGLSRRQAIRGQLITGFGAIVGSSLSSIYSRTSQCTAWVLPFTSGAFIYISLVKTMPELVKLNKIKNILRQISGFIIGTVLVYLIFISFD